MPDIFRGRVCLLIAVLLATLLNLLRAEEGARVAGWAFDSTGGGFSQRSQSGVHGLLVKALMQ